MSKPVFTALVSSPPPNETSDPAALLTLSCRVCSAVSPCLMNWTCRPSWLRLVCRLASVLLAWRTMLGRLCAKVVTWLEIGFASRTPMPATTRKKSRYTSSTAKPRGTPDRRTSATSGLSTSAISPATRNRSRTLLARSRITHGTSTAKGSSTSCTQRGISVRGAGRAGACGPSPSVSACSPAGGGLLGVDAPGAASPRAASMVGPSGPAGDASSTGTGVARTRSSLTAARLPRGPAVPSWAQYG